MNINFKRLFLFILIIATVGLIFAAGYIAYTLNREPSVTNTNIGTGTAVCSTFSGVQCWYDNPSNVCNPPAGSDDALRHMQGRRICTGSQVGQFGVCTFYDACAPFVREGDPCTGNYRGKAVPGNDVTDDRIRRLSTGEGQNFVGCEAVLGENSVVLGSSGRNCFCDTAPVFNDPNYSFSGSFPIFNQGTVRCAQDQNNDSCGANVVILTPTPSPTSTNIPTVTPTFSITPSPTISMTPSATPSISPSPTLTPSVSPTITPSPTSSPTLFPSQIPTPTQPILITPLPQTAIFDDNSDKIILGMFLVIIGIITIYFGYDKLIGKTISIRLNTINSKYIDKEEIKNSKKKDFEQKIIKDIDKA